MNWIVFLFAIEAGLINHGTNLYNGDQAIFYNDSATQEIASHTFASYTLFEAEAIILDHIFIGAGIESRQLFFEKGTDFFPYEVVYPISAGIRWRGIEVGVSHFCKHMIHVDPIEDIDPFIWEHETKIYARYEFGGSP